MKPQIKLISTDFDGTIFSEFETPPIPVAFTGLIGQLQAQGVKWVINTGRDMASLLESLGRARIPVQPDYIVVVEREVYEHQHGRYASLARWNDACTADHAALFARVATDVADLEGWIASKFFATVYEDPHSPLCVIAANNGDMDVIHRRLDEYCRTVPGLTVVRNDVYARFSHAAYNKGTALAEITRLLGLHAANVFAVGDHLNDLPMLRREYAEFLAAPANSVPEVVATVRAAGGYVSRHSQGHGVCEALQFHLNEPMEVI
jgi:hydroxymethylpyrimidine pyrophosphatase-like HAD family hydrolase